MLPYPDTQPADDTRPQPAAPMFEPDGAATSRPEWMWSPRFSPNMPVTVPRTGQLTPSHPAPPPPPLVGVVLPPLEPEPLSERGALRSGVLPEPELPRSGE